MASNATQRANDGDITGATLASTKKSGGMKMFLMATAMLAAEGALIAGGFMFFDPSNVAADVSYDAATVVVERVTEVQLIDEKLTNDRGGAVHVYPVEIYVHVAESEPAWFEDVVGQFQNEIRSEVTALWRSVDRAALEDPRMEMMTRRVLTLLRERFEGEAAPEVSRIGKVVIVSGTGFRIRG